MRGTPQNWRRGQSRPSLVSPPRVKAGGRGQLLPHVGARQGEGQVRGHDRCWRFPPPKVGLEACAPRHERSQGDLLVLTPARNEAENLAKLHRRLAKALDGADIAWRWLLVDDASDDGTFAGLAAIAERDARVAAVRHAEPAGSHAAILAGIRLAAARPEIASVAILAADLQDPPEALPRLVAAWRDGAEIVFAARSGWADVPFHRRFAGRAVHTAVRLVLPGSRYPWSGTDMGVFRAPRDRRVGARRPAGRQHFRPRGAARAEDGGRAGREMPRASAAAGSGARGGWRGSARRHGGSVRAPRLHGNGRSLPTRRGCRMGRAGTWED